MTPIILDNKKIHDLIVAKDTITNSVRKLSGDIESLDIKIKRFEQKEIRITEKVIVPKELTDRGDEIVKQIGLLDKELGILLKKINDAKLSAVPKEMKDEHMQLLKDKEVIERERNKVALKVQKIKDKLIPLVQKEVTPLLHDRFDDIETAKTKDGKVYISTFNHLDEYKKKFRR